MGEARSHRRRAHTDLTLVGRRALVAELAAAARAAATGHGSVVLLTGEAGVGKTSVARALATEVRDDLVVTWGTCTADGAAPPFWPWRAVIPDATAPETSTRSPRDPAIGAERLVALSELRDRVHARAQQRPALHVIEDLQWADVASVLLLAHATVGIAGVPLMLVATIRTGEPLAVPLDDALDEVRQRAEVREVSPFSRREVDALATAIGVGVGADLADLVHERTGGNPLFVTEVLRAVRTEPPDRHHAAAAAGVPERVSELIGRRLARLPDAVADLLLAASVVGREGDVRTLAAVCGMPPAAVVDLLEQGRAARVLDAAPAGRWQFRHDLVRDAVGATASDAARARAHGAALDALAATGTTPPAVLAHHALAAQPLLDADRAVALAAQAGERAFAQHAYEEAVTWFTRALDAAPVDLALRWRAELLVLCGEAQRHMGRVGAAREAFASAAALTDDPGLLARAALGYADPGADLGIAYRSEDAQTPQLLARAIDAQPHGDSVALVRLEARLAAELHFSDAPDRARELARSAVAGAGRLGDPRAAGAAWAVMHDAYVVGQAPLDEQLRGSAQLLEWARRAGTAGAHLTAHRARVFDLLAAADLHGVDAEVLAFRRVAEPLGVPGYLWWLDVWSAMRALLEGRHEAAETRAVAACELGVASFPVLAVINLSFLVFFLRREQGRLAEMEEGTRDVAASHPDVPAIRVALALLLAETGRADEARGLVAALATDLDRLHDRNWPASWFQLARVASVVDDRHLAATLLRPEHHPSERCVMVSLATACLGATALATAWLHHTVGDLDAAHDAYTAAEDRNARLGARSWLAQARADHARLLLDRGAPGDGPLAAALLALASEAGEAIGLRSIAPVLGSLRDRTTTTATPSGPATPHPATSDPSRSPATFRRRGAVWELDYAGRAVQVPHARGLDDLAVLLSRPGEAVAALELLDPDRAAPTAARGAPTLDERARREIRRRLSELDREVDEAEAAHDGERAALAREARQQLAEAVARDLGLGGRARRVDDPVERARKTVSTRLRRTISTIERHHPELGRHLERSVDTGSWCAYRPAEPITWRT